MLKKQGLDKNIAYLIHDIGRHLRKIFDEEIKTLGITRTQWWVLANLYMEDGITQTQLAELVEMERAPLGLLLDRLQAMGWIRRESHPEDKRAKLIVIEDDRRGSLELLIAKYREVDAKIFASLPEQRVEELVVDLQEIREELVDS